MIHIDKANDIFELNGDIDNLWNDLKEIMISIISLSEYLEDKDYIKDHIQKITDEYEIYRKDLIADLIDKAAQKEKEEKLSEWNEGKLNDLLHI